MGTEGYDSLSGEDWKWWSQANRSIEKLFIQKVTGRHTTGTTIV